MAAPVYMVSEVSVIVIVSVSVEVVVTSITGDATSVEVPAGTITVA